MAALLTYLVLLVGAAVVIKVLWTTEKPPAAGWVTFLAFYGLLVVFILIDTKRLDSIPGLRMGASVYQLEKRIEKVEKDSLGYETEQFSRRDIRERARVTEVGSSDWFRYETKFILTYPAISDSVMIWENDVPISPARFTVKDREVVVRSTQDPRRPSEGSDETPSLPPYVIRYLRLPSTAVVSETP